MIKFSCLLSWQILPCKATLSVSRYSQILHYPVGIGCQDHRNSAFIFPFSLFLVMTFTLSNLEMRSFLLTSMKLYHKFPSPYKYESLGFSSLLGSFSHQLLMVLWKHFCGNGERSPQGSLMGLEERHCASQSIFVHNLLQVTKKSMGPALLSIHCFLIRK